jgi:hypothetical protein
VMIGQLANSAAEAMKSGQGAPRQADGRVECAPMPHVAKTASALAGPSLMR